MAVRIENLVVNGRTEIQRVILCWQSIGLNDAALILVILVAEGARLKAVWVLSVEQLRAQKCLIHLFGIICRLRKVLLILI